ncbi:MAG: flagellar export chaperone FliS [Alicyclobacillus sp.]|nr:flagellar export chaperone FliS [Alicyclobacillus sp.]
MTNPYAQSYSNAYRQASVNTASPSRLVVMLYDGLLRFMNQAAEAADQGQIETVHRNLLRAQDIVLELRSSLDHSKAPVLCSNLNDLYAYFYSRLVDANRLKSSEPIREILPMVQSLRDAWAEADRQLSMERSE